MKLSLLQQKYLDSLHYHYEKILLIGKDRDDNTINVVHIDNGEWCISYSNDLNHYFEKWPYELPIYNNTVIPEHEIETIQPLTLTQ